ncbi:MAG: hypothetical protein HRU29_05210 [Rhizobiales bacterium]|nr:hypothetical protein [Hyphomicrobiales bacterium]NRB13781.1 hypothetical protein [Hyphomicrobiales bacterium]
MHYLPISLKTKDAHIALIGNGEAALNKLRLLVKTSAQINLFAPAPSLELAAFLIQNELGHINHIKHNPTKTDFNNIVAIFACHAALADNEALAKLANAQNIPFNSPDNPQICSFIVPSIVDRSPVTIAISTEGAAPVLAKQVRAHLEHYLPQNTGKLAIFAQSVRQQVQNKLSSAKAKRHFWENFFHGKIATSFLNGQTAAAKKLVEQNLSNPSEIAGKLYVIHTTNPDLLTIKSARILQLADTIYQLESDISDIEAFTHLARRDAKFVKISTNPDKPQDGEIIMQIANQVRQGEISVVIGDESSQKRKDKISNHLLGKQIDVEHLNSVLPDTKPQNQFSQAIF